MNTVGVLLLLLPLLLLLLYEVKDSLPTKNFVELRSNDVGTTVVDYWKGVLRNVASDS